LNTGKEKHKGSSAQTKKDILLHITTTVDIIREHSVESSTKQVIKEYSASIQDHNFQHQFQHHLKEQLTRPDYNIPLLTKVNDTSKNVKPQTNQHI